MDKNTRLEKDMDVFRKRWQHLVPKMIDYELDKHGEIIITLKDGMRLSYDPIGSTLRKYFGGIEDIINADENKWRAGFAARLERLMREANVAQWELSRRTGISEVTLSKYMNGYSTPSAFNARKLAKALDCSITDLCDF